MALKTIEAHLDEKGFLVVSRLPCINHGENVSVAICVTADDDFFAKQPSSVNYFFEFESADGKKQISSPLQFENGVLSCKIKNSVLCCPGEAQVQIVATDQNSGYVFKSSVATFFVAQSINATEQDFELLDLLTKLNQLYQQTSAIKDGAEQTMKQMQSLFDTLNTKLANGDFVGEKGDMGDKGEKGDTGDSPTILLQDGVLYAEYQN